MRGAPLSQEHKDKMAAARRAAREARLAARNAAPPEPPVPVTETPEFKAAIAVMKQQLLDELAAIRPAQPSMPSDEFWADKLAGAIAQQTDPGRAIVAPDEMERRKKAGAEMGKLLARCHAVTGRLSASGDLNGAIEESPQYELVSKVYLNIGNGDELIEPMQRGQDNVLRPSRICWLSAPSRAMRPVNRRAQEIMSAYLRSVGDIDNTGACDFQGGDIEPPPAGGFIETDYDMTRSGHAVVGLSAAQIGSKAHAERGSGERQQFSQFGMILDQRNQPTQHNSGGPPYVDVRVLGTIAAPARQNG